MGRIEGEVERASKEGCENHRRLKVRSETVDRIRKNEG